MTTSPVSLEFGAADPLADASPLAHRLVPSELAYCAQFRRWREHVAARILAKRVVVSQLRWTGAPRWHDIEILRLASGQPRVILTGMLRTWRDDQGLPTPAVSMSHARSYSAALGWLPRTGTP